MIKPTPNPPETETSPYESLDSRKLHDAAERALDHYLKPNDSGQKPRTPSAMFQIVGDMDNESLLAHACESLASANTLAGDFADQLGRPQRNTALAIQQIIMLAELAVNRALDRVDPQA